MKLSRFVGVAGTNGSGKDTLGRVLEHEGYRAASLSDILRTEATKRGLEHTREHLSSISHELRMELGEGALSQRLIEEASADEKLVISSLRVPGEVEAIQKRGGIIVWIDAVVVINELEYVWPFMDEGIMALIAPTQKSIDEIVEAFLFKDLHDFTI